MASRPGTRLPRYPGGAVRRGRDHGRGAWRRRRVRHLAPALNGSDSTAPDWRPVTVANDAPARLTAPPEDGAFPPPLGPQLLIRDPERTAGGIRIGERLYGALDMALGPRRARPFSELMERLADAGLPCRFSVLIEGGGLAGLDACHDKRRGGLPGVLVRRQFAGAQRHARPHRARRRRPCHRPAAPRPADLGRAGRRGRRAAPLPEPPAAACRGLGRDGVHAVGRRSPGKPRRVGAGVLLRRHRRARARAAYRSAAPAAGGQARAIVEQRRGASVPLNRRQAPAVRLGRRRGLRLRVDLRRPRTRQVGADEQPRPRLQPARRPGPAAVIRDHRYRAVLGRVDLADPRSLAAGAPPRGRLVRAADDTPSTRSTRATPSSAAARRCPPSAPSWSTCWV